MVTRSCCSCGHKFKVWLICKTGIGSRLLNLEFSGWESLESSLQSDSAWCRALNQLLTWAYCTSNPVTCIKDTSTDRTGSVMAGDSTTSDFTCSVFYFFQNTHHRCLNLASGIQRGQHISEAAVFTGCFKDNVVLIREQIAAHSLTLSLNLSLSFYPTSANSGEGEVYGLVNFAQAFLSH